jgi:transketolase
VSLADRDIEGEGDQVDNSCSAGWGREVDFDRLKELARLCRGDILTMTNIAGSGHPGGSMSSVDIYLTLFSIANVDPQNPYDPARDRIVVSHGHTSPGVYSVLGRLGFIPRDEVMSLFRRGGSPYEGHVERSIPGVEWTTGNLGQGLSAGCGFALASWLLEVPYHVFVVMSDAEQAKGQVSEARRFAIKHRITNLTVIIDYNEIQIGGSVHDVMPVNIAANYASDGWKVMEVDGHDYRALHQAILEAKNQDLPVVIIAKTTIGKGVSFMEGKEEYHGRALNEDEFQKALA